MYLITNLDQMIFQQIHLIQNSWATTIMFFVTNLLSPVTLPIFALLLIGWLLYKKQISKIALIIFGLGGGFLIETILKIIVARPRPPFGLAVETDYSFPSGHATLAIIFFSLLIYCFKDEIKNIVLRRLFIALNIVLFLLVGFSRIYLSVHWFSDVIAGFLFGIIWLVLVKKIITPVCPLTKNKWPSKIWQK
jgi:undecaprenyl-diphosphatase